MMMSLLAAAAKVMMMVVMMMMMMMMMTIPSPFPQGPGMSIESAFYSDEADNTNTMVHSVTEIVRRALSDDGTQLTIGVRHRGCQLITQLLMMIPLIITTIFITIIIIIAITVILLLSSSSL
jgi:hypothetical protein